MIIPGVVLEEEQPYTIQLFTAITGFTAISKISKISNIRELTGKKGTASGIFQRHQGISGWWEKVFFLRNKNRGI